MNKTELIVAVSESTKQSKAAVTEVINAALEQIGESLIQGESITLPGFGTFLVRDRAARIGRNPQTGEQIQIAAAKAPAFKAGKALRDAVNAN